MAQRKRFLEHKGDVAFPPVMTEILFIIDAEVPVIRFRVRQKESSKESGSWKRSLYDGRRMQTTGLTYSLTGNTKPICHRMSHFQNLKACNSLQSEGKARRIIVDHAIPLRKAVSTIRTSRESLVLAHSDFQDMVRMGVDNIFTFVAHDLVYPMPSAEQDL